MAEGIKATIRKAMQAQLKTAESLRELVCVRVEIGSQNGKISKYRTGIRDCGIVSTTGRQPDPLSVFDYIYNRATSSGFFGLAWVEVDLFGESVKDVRKGVEQTHQVGSN